MNNQEPFNKNTNNKLNKEVPTYKLTTPSIIKTPKKKEGVEGKAKKKKRPKGKFRDKL